MVMGLVSRLSLANDSHSGSSLVVHAVLSQDGFWQGGFWEVSRSCRASRSTLLLLFIHYVMSDSLQPHGLSHARLPCPSLSPRVSSNSYPLNQRCHPTIASSVTPFSSCLLSFPASGSFPVSLFFTGGQSIGASASASVFPMNIQG